MKFISHRGNLNGKNPETENLWEQIDKCLALHYDVEIDVWYVNNKFYLGHDHPVFMIDIELLENTKLWCHAKNYEALQQLKNYNINYFWHENDKYTLTSHGFIWAYPGQSIGKNTICVMPELSNYSVLDLNSCYGICSDNISEYVRLLEIYL